ncbi:MAG: Rpn family recombination-promoting nuclease/putative transposase [Bacteroidales bacterium]|nr:Rpn family recombination-promoting nuclease/putative transposase [Bacteroidales bacterium]
MATRSMISFDYALKQLLRNKANYEVLEGFLSELIRRKIIVHHMGESESNQTDKDGKYNRVDVLVEADDKELVIIELQFDNQNDYFHRMLYGVSKSISEYMQKGEPYSKVRKAYSINIVHFDLGEGDDYVYHGFTHFTGLHTHNELKLNDEQFHLYGKSLPGELYPEFYIIKVRQFNDVAKDSLDEWVYYLKNNKIKDDFTAQGLDRARQILAYDKLCEKEKREYFRQAEIERIRASEIETALLKGERKGRVEGLAKGLEKATVNSHLAGYSTEDISTITGLSQEDIIAILQREKLL